MIRSQKKNYINTYIKIILKLNEIKNRNKNLFIKKLDFSRKIIFIINLQGIQKKI